MVNADPDRTESPGPADRSSTHVERVFSVVEALVAAEEPVGPRALARRAGIDRSAVGRILRQLSDVGIAERNERGYVAGARLFVLGRRVAAMDDLTRAAMPILHRLAGQFDETCYVCIRQGDAGVLFDQVESTRPVRYVVPLDRPYPLYAGASGLAILSGLPPPELDELLLRISLEPLTAATVRDKDQLRRRIQEGRTIGYTATAGERVEGGFAVASPFFGADGTCRGSIVLTLPLSRLDEARIPEYGAAVRAAALDLTGRLGFHQASPAVVSDNHRRPGAGV